MNMKQTKKLFVIFLIVVLGSLGYGFYLGQHIAAIDEIDLKNVKVAIMLDFAGYEGSDEKTVMQNVVYDNDANTFDKLYEKSDVIAKVSVAKRSQSFNTISSEVSLLDLYKGNLGNEKTIKLYEPFGFYQKNQIMIFGACLPMREDQTYIVFLKEDENHCFRLTSSLYGKYNTKEDAYLKMQDDKLTAKDMMKNDMIVLDKEKYKESSLKSGFTETDFMEYEEGYQRLAGLKETRETIRASFQKLR